MKARIASALALAASLGLAACAPASTSQSEGPSPSTQGKADTYSAPIGVISSPMVVDPSIIGNTDDYHRVQAIGSTLVSGSKAILSAQLDAVAKANAKAVILNGNLSLLGDATSLKGVATLLSDFREKTGIAVIVNPGPLDIKSTIGENLKDGSLLDGLSAADFASAFSASYQNPDVVATASDGLSYAVRVNGKDSDSGTGLTVLSLADGISDAMGPSDLGAWAYAQADEATKRGDSVMVVNYHSLGLDDPSSSASSSWIQNFDFPKSHNIHYVLSASSLTNDMAQLDGLYDISGAASTGYPLSYRVLDFQSQTDGSGKAPTSQVEVNTVSLAGPLSIPSATDPTAMVTLSDPVQYALDNGFSSQKLPLALLGLRDRVSRTLENRTLLDWVSEEGYDPDYVAGFLAGAVGTVSEPVTMDLSASGLPMSGTLSIGYGDYSKEYGYPAEKLGNPKACFGVTLTVSSSDDPAISGNVKVYFTVDFIKTLYETVLSEAQRVGLGNDSGYETAAKILNAGILDHKIDSDHTVADLAKTLWAASVHGNEAGQVPSWAKAASDDLSSGIDSSILFGDGNFLQSLPDVAVEALMAVAGDFNIPSSVYDMVVPNENAVSQLAWKTMRDSLVSYTSPFANAKASLKKSLNDKMAQDIADLEAGKTDTDLGKQLAQLAETLQTLTQDKGPDDWTGTLSD